MLSCEQIQAALSASLDGEEPGLPADIMEAHLAGCSDCQAFYAQAAQVNRQLHFQQSTPAAPDLAAEILAGIDDTWQRQIRLRATWSWMCRLALVALAVFWGLWAIRLIGTASSAVESTLYIDAAAIRLALAAMLIFIAIFPRFAGGIIPFLGAWWSFSFGVRLQDIVQGAITADNIWFLLMLLLTVVVLTLTWLVQVGCGVIRETFAQLRS